MTALDHLLARLFAATVRRYPRNFRDRAEAEMLRAFEEGQRSRLGGRARLWWGVRELADAAGGLAKAWIETRKHGHGGRTTMRAGTLLDGLDHDVRMALRQLIRQPGFAVFVGVTLALGIGANAAVFSVLHSVLIAPLPYDEPGRLVRMYWNERGQDQGSMSEPAFLDFRDHLTSVRIAAYDNYGGRDFGADIMVDGRAERVRLLFVNGDYFHVLGADMILGRPLSRDDPGSLQPHRNLVVHRDLKPGNILVGAMGVGVPRLPATSLVSPSSSLHKSQPYLKRPLQSKREFSAPEDSARVTGRRRTSRSDLKKLLSLCNREWIPPSPLGRVGRMRRRSRSGPQQSQSGGDRVSPGPRPRARGPCGRIEASQPVDASRRRRDCGTEADRKEQAFREWRGY